MSVEIFDISKNVVTVTPEAARHLKQQADASGLRGVRISVKESGCSGYMYVMKEVDAGEPGDVEVKLDNGLSLFIEAQSVGLLQGTELDYVREGINRTLKFFNPNVTAACGCGESFSVA
jgi:iron-sulfur cluster assembly accessory protein